MEEADLLAFRDAHGLDERCMRGLASLSAGDRLVVMDSVNSMQCNNPSAVTWSGVKRVQSEPGGLKLEYVLRHLDEKCLEVFQKLPRQAQEQIAMKLDAASCRNVSAFVFSQVRSVQSMPGQAHPQHPVVRLQSGRPALPFPTQRARSRSPLIGRRDLSACSTEDLLAEVQRIHSELATRTAMQAQQLPRQQPRSAEMEGLTPDAAAFAASMNLDGKVQQALAALDGEAQRIAIGLVDLQAARNPSAVMWSMVKRLREARAEAKQEFIERSLDQEARAAWTNVAPELKMEILSSVDLSKIRNVSAVIWSRIRDSDGSFGVKDAGEESQVQDIIRAYRPQVAEDPPPMTNLGLDERASAELSRLPPELQEQILREVPANCRNPSANVWSKVKQYRNIAEPMPTMAPAVASLGPPPPVELDERCSQKFNALPPELQAQILSEVPANCRNPSAYVWSKIKAVKV